MSNTITMRRSNYLNKNIDLLNNVNIYEYDMSSGGFNVLRSKNRLSDNEVDYLLSVDKLERSKYIGKKSLKDPTINEDLINGFKEYMTIFCDNNGIEDSNILSVKKDAIFVIDKRCSELKVNDYIELKEKNKYNSYMYLNEKEFYNGRDSLDIKGIKKEAYGENAFYKEIRKIMTLIEKGNEQYLFKYIKKLQKNYLNYTVDVELYRELNEFNMFRVDYAGDSLRLEEAHDDFKYYLNTDYNYFNYLINIIKVLV